MLMVFLQVSRSSAQRKKLSLSLVDYTAIQTFNINPIQDGEGGGKPPPPGYQFFPCNFYKRKN